jgi:antitoxin component of RelBE/YafQ-DinJ toxin-antitoxin module
MKTATIHTRIKPEIKNQAEQIWTHPHRGNRDILPSNLPLQNGLPFPVEIPNKCTFETSEED